MSQFMTRIKMNTVMEKLPRSGLVRWVEFVIRLLPSIKNREPDCLRQS